MEQSPWQNNRPSATQEISRILWNPGFFTAFTTASPLFVSWVRSIQSMPLSHFLEIHINIFLPSMPKSSKWSVPRRFSYQHHVCTSPLPLAAKRPAHFSFLDLITGIMFVEEYRSWCSSLYSILHSPAASSLLAPYIFIGVQFWKTLSLRSSLTMRDPISYSYQTTSKITVL